MKLGKKLPFFKYMYTIYFFLAKLNFLKDFFTTTLNLLNLIGFWPTFRLFHYAKLLSYKRVRWGRLAGPSVMYFLKVNIDNYKYFYKKNCFTCKIYIFVFTDTGLQKECQESGLISEVGHCRLLPIIWYSNTTQLVALNSPIILCIGFSGKPKLYFYIKNSFSKTCTNSCIGCLTK